MRTHEQHQDKDCASWQFVVDGSTINTVHSEVAEQQKTAPLQHHYGKCNSQFWMETMKNGSCNKAHLIRHVGQQDLFDRVRPH